ncbi:MAG: hypothetical protein EA001_07030 [Oscillatoriales cyanobacterium]|nr:MAG: hypothetical protein EA001_07030 [Oscillatoriales cyanobacterium]
MRGDREIFGLAEIPTPTASDPELRLATLEGPVSPIEYGCQHHQQQSKPMKPQPDLDPTLTARQRFWGGASIGLVGLAFAALYCYGVTDVPWPVAGWFLGVGSSSLLGLLAVKFKADPRRMLTALLDSLPG